MKSTTIAMIAGIIAAVAGYFITPQYVANPLLDEHTTGIILNVISLAGVIVTAIAGTIEAKSNKS